MNITSVVRILFFECFNFFLERIQFVIVFNLRYEYDTLNEKNESVICNTIISIITKINYNKTK